MGRRLQADLGEMRNRVTAALRHLFDLLENQAVVIFSKRCPHRESKNHDESRSNQFSHEEISKRKIHVWQRLSAFGSAGRVSSSAGDVGWIEQSVAPCQVMAAKPRC